MDLGNKILKLRKKAGLSQEQLGEKVNVTRQTISNWELGETTPNTEQLKLLSKELNVSIDELLDNDVKDVLIDKVTNTEKMSGTILTLIKFLVFVIILGIIIFIFLASYKIYRKSKIVRREESIYCKLYGEEHGISIVYDELTGVPLESGSDAYFYDILDLDKYNNVHQIFNIINDYVKRNGGTCEIVEERNLNHLIDVSIKEGSLTKTGLTIVIKERYDYDFSYGEPFWLERYNYQTSSYEKLPINEEKNCAFNLPAYGASPSKPLELRQDWSCMYGELSKGLYRIVKDVFFESDIPVTEDDMYYLWVEFEIE